MQAALLRGAHRKSEFEKKKEGPPNQEGMGPGGPIPVKASTPCPRRTRSCCRRRCGCYRPDRRPCRSGFRPRGFRFRFRFRSIGLRGCRSNGSGSMNPYRRSDRRASCSRPGCHDFRLGFPSRSTYHSRSSTPGFPDCPWNLTPCEGRRHCRPHPSEAARSVPPVTYVNEKGPPPPKGRVRSWWAILGGIGSSLPQNLVSLS